MGQTYKILFLVIIMKILTIFDTNAAINYCNLPSCQNHTLCLYHMTGSRCGLVRPVIGLTNSEKQRIINIHNSIRRIVASGLQTGKDNQTLPAADNIPALSWDDEMERIAQTWANQCPTESDLHDECRNMVNYEVGQNVGIIIKKVFNSLDFDVQNHFQNFYNEAANVDEELINSYRNDQSSTPTWAHFTNMIWANTTTIGCGKIRYRLGIQHAQVLVCNYGPAGNIPGQEVYKTV